VDRLVMRFADVLFAFPIILLAIGVIAILGTNTASTVVAIAVVYAPIFARLMRAPTLVLRSSDYVHAARSFGAGDLRIIVRHIMPNLMSVILVQASLSLSTAILLEASLSFLGIGAQPPAPSLGRMLSEGREYMFMAPWASLFSGLAILLASLGFNLLGDGLRDRLDPRLRGID
jgi:peptide/nickel transport system permease protein